MKEENSEYVCMCNTDEWNVRTYIYIYRWRERERVNGVSYVVMIFYYYFFYDEHVRGMWTAMDDK